jgi:hypothetical protein
MSEMIAWYYKINLKRHERNTYAIPKTMKPINELK